MCELVAITFKELSEVTTNHTIRSSPKATTDRKLLDRATNYDLMKFADAFRETLFRFNVTGRDLAAQSGLTVQQISKFKNGAEIRTDTLEKLLEAMSPEAREYFMGLVLSHSRDHVPLPKETIETADIQQ
jgi:DNA-binding Xre family transcriptional regulator